MTPPITRRQMQALRAFAENPGAPVSEIAPKLGITVSAMYGLMQPLIDAKYLREQGTVAIGPACGQCPCCRQPVFKSPPPVRHAGKLTPEQRRQIAMSVGSGPRVAKRFGISPTVVYLIRRQFAERSEKAVP